MTRKSKIRGEWWIANDDAIDVVEVCRGRPAFVAVSFACDAAARPEPLVEDVAAFVQPNGLTLQGVVLIS
jgi:hypothetical protein